MQYYLTKIKLLPTPLPSFHQGQFQKKNENALHGRSYYVSRTQATERHHFPGGGEGELQA